MPQERDPSGRFVKTPGDGAQAGPEPEAEPEEPVNLAQLLVAVDEQIRGLERRQTEARETDNAAMRACGVTSPNYIFLCNGACGEWRTRAVKYQTTK